MLMVAIKLFDVERKCTMMHCMRRWIYLDLLFIESIVKFPKEAKL